MLDRARLSVLSSMAATLGVALAPASAFAERHTWRALRIDGGSPGALEVSLASLQNALPTNKRDDFEIESLVRVKRSVMVSAVLTPVLFAPKPSASWIISFTMVT